jgi:hypothetical protein
LGDAGVFTSWEDDDGGATDACVATIFDDDASDDSAWRDAVEAIKARRASEVDALRAQANGKWVDVLPWIDGRERWLRRWCGLHALGKRRRHACESEEAEHDDTCQRGVVERHRRACLALREQ